MRTPPPTARLPAVVKPVRGDLLAGVSVALVLVPQALAYAEIAGVDPVYGLYAAVAAPIAGAFVGSSPYLQTGPVAVTSLLTFGALGSLGEPFTARFALLAGLLAILVGLIRLVIGLVGAGPVAYLMSQPVVVSFTSAGAALIISSQIPSLLGTEGGSGQPCAHRTPGHRVTGGVVPDRRGGRGRRHGDHARRTEDLGPLPRGALVAVVAGSLWSWATDYDGSVVGDIEVELVVRTDLPWGDLPVLLLPALVIAIVGFAEPSAIARRYAAEDRTYWDSNREFVGRGRRTSPPSGRWLPRWAARSRGPLSTGWEVPAPGGAAPSPASPSRHSCPWLFLLAPLPKAVLAGLVIAAVYPDRREVTRALLALVASAVLVGVVTAVGTLVLAPPWTRAAQCRYGARRPPVAGAQGRCPFEARRRHPARVAHRRAVLRVGSGVERSVTQLIAQHRGAADRRTPRTARLRRPHRCAHVARRPRRGAGGRCRGGADGCQGPRREAALAGARGRLPAQSDSVRERPTSC